jgi:tRNA threonylcarbamoyladenosine biosynthesis protein TsaE
MLCRSEEETLRVAARLAKRVKAPAVITLSGPLGAGKTTFVRGYLRGLGHKGGVPSPTFALVNEYRRTRPRVYHMDLYRIEGADPANMEFAEYFDDPEAITLIEWPQAAAAQLPKERLEIKIDHAKDGRTISMRGVGPRLKKAVQ